MPEPINTNLEQPEPIVKSAPADPIVKSAPTDPITTSTFSITLQDKIYIVLILIMIYFLYRN